MDPTRPNSPRGALATPSLEVAAVFHGPNPFSSKPVVVVRVPADDLQQAVPLRRAEQRLREAWPDWLARAPIEVADEVTRAAGCAAALALGALTDLRGFLHAAGARHSNDGAVAWVGFHDPEISLAALRLAFQTLIAAGRDDFSPTDIAPRLQQLLGRCRQRHPDYQARILMQGADNRDIPVLPFVPASKYWQYGWGNRSRVFYESASNADGFVGNTLQRSKVLGKAAFRALGIPTPRHVLVSTPQALDAAATTVGWPCVVKPLDLGGGKGVTAGIRSSAALREAFVEARRYSNGPIMIEAFVRGDDHRLMVVGGRLIAAIRREPSSIIGDGRSTVRELVAALNARRSSNMVKSGYLRPIPLDQTLARHLAAQECTLDTVPARGAPIFLRSNANLSTGGICIDVTQRLHPQVARLAELVSATLGLHTVGLDYITTNIEATPADCGGSFIEANTTPGLDAAIAAGWNANELADVVLGDLPGRIPISLVVLPKRTADEAPLARWSHAFPADTALVCRGRTVVGGVPLPGDDPAPWSAVHRALRHRAVCAVVILCTVEEIVRHGLPTDKADHALLCGTAFTPDWQAVLGRSVAVIETLSEAAAFVDGEAVSARLRRNAIPMQPS